MPGAAFTLETLLLDWLLELSELRLCLLKPITVSAERQGAEPAAASADLPVGQQVQPRRRAEAHGETRRHDGVVGGVEG